MRFSSWPFLILLAVLPLLYKWWLRRNTPPAVRFPVPVGKSARKSNPVKYVLAIRLVGLALFIIALARPQTSYQQVHRQVSGIDIMMVMDTSASMNIEDLSQQSRAEVAKETMRGFIKGRQNDRIGFLVFSGEALTLAPPTLDYGLVLRSVRDAEVGSLKDGTAIGDGLSVAVARLRNSKAKSRVIILLTDGDNNVGQVDPATAGELAAGYSIRVYTIAIGREGRVKLPIRRKGPFGKTITTYQWFDNALNPELLKHIASITDGKFYRVTDAEALNNVFREIDQLERTQINSTEKTRYKDKYQGPLKWGTLLIVLEQILSSGWWRLAI